MTGKLVAGLAVAVVLTISGVLVVSYRHAARDNAKQPPEGQHQSAHGGCLNAMGTCENGHAEVKVEGDVMKLWFVGGGSDTLRAVRVPDSRIDLAVSLDGHDQARALVLQPAPSDLAEEKVGDCSHFEGKADWLSGAKKFIATGQVTFRGSRQELRIEYPSGYDPD